MKQINLTIDNKKITIEEGGTLLTAAKKLKISIPTMCYRNGFPHFTSCMICVVKEIRWDKLLPACSAIAEEGMVIETDSEEIRESRRTALELLLSEHVGDCEGPCRVACPADMNIPLMLKQIEAGQMNEALITVKEHIPLPAILGRICPVPCEKGCRRTQVDQSIAICLLKRYVADLDLQSEKPYLPPKKKSSGKKIAIVGSGPTGLTAAYYLLREGHRCILFDKEKEPGGTLRRDVPEILLPRTVLNDEIALIRRMGAEFKPNTTVGKDLTLEWLRKQHDAVILVLGSVKPEQVRKLGIESSKTGIQVNPDNYMTSMDGVFAGGSALRPVKMAIKSVADGKNIADAIGFYFKEKGTKLPPKRFNSRIGQLLESEKENFKDTTDQIEIDRQPNQNLNDNKTQDISKQQAILESARCLHCECLKPNDCKLRDLSQEYEINQSRFKVKNRYPMKKITDHLHVIYEPGKCIKCGLCVRITKKQGEKLGLTFIGRGFDVTVGVPLNQTLDKALVKVAGECIAACPTGALAEKN